MAKKKPRPKPSSKRAGNASKRGKAKAASAGGRANAVASNQPVLPPANVAKARTQPSTLGPGRARAAFHGGMEAVGRPADRATVEEGLRAAPPAPVWEAPTAHLPDVAIASFGEPPPRVASVIGVDQRVQITDTTVFPFSALASLLIVARDNSTWIGSAWFISPRTLATAGHCVFINSPQLPARHGWVKSISVMPGRNVEQLPFGAATSTDFRSSEGWTVNGDPNFDYGAIVLPTPLGDQTGVFGFGVFPDAELAGIDVNVAGYPGDKPVGTHWHDHRQVASVNPLKVFYDLDTAGGQSGSAVYRIEGGETTAVAIHAYGVGGGAQSNSGTRITQEVFDNLVSWKR